MASPAAPTSTLDLKPQETAKSFLLALPNELLVEICTHLCWHCQSEQAPLKSWPSATEFGSNDEQRDLLNLACTHSRLLKIAEPVLHHFVERCLIGPRFHLRRLPDLERPITSRNLRSLYLTMYTAEGGPTPFWNLGQDFVVPRLERLTTLAVSLEVNVPNEHPLDLVRPILQMAPSLRQLEIDEQSKSYLGEELFEFPRIGMQLSDLPPLQNLVELRLSDTRLTATCLATLLGAVGPSLSRVIIRRLAPRLFVHESWQDGNVILFDELLEALEPWRDTLKELSFVVYNNTELHHPDNAARDFCRVGLLRGFRALEVLEASTGCFDFTSLVWPTRKNSFVSTLPASIRELRLWTQSHVGFAVDVPGVQRLLEAFAAGEFPHLRKLCLEDPRDAMDPSTEEELEEIGAKFRSAGVNYRRTHMEGDMQWLPPAFD